MALPLVHHPHYDAQTVPDGHRFPMRKYARLAERLARDGRRFEAPAPAPAGWLTLAHDAGYVSAILSQTLPRAAARRIGFEITPAVARRASLSVGGTVLAARLALEHGAAANLAGGSHHAGPDGGAGFCVFNDVAVAAHVLLADGLVRSVAVIDCDVHHGDGTARTFDGDPRVFTASLHCAENWPRHKPPSDLDIALARGRADAAYLAALDDLLEGVFAGTRPDLVFYNGGVDPHEEDRLGLLCLSDAGLAERDRRVAAACAIRGIPVCGVLGGGYSRDIDALVARHALMVEALDGVGVA